VAGCWRDRAVIQEAQNLARQLLPDVAQNMPEVLVCDPGDFQPQVAGIYEFPVHRIRLHPNWVGTPQGTGHLIHELAHAAVWLRYGDSDRTANGHGVEWMRIMLALGRQADAERTAWTHASSGGREALMAALADTQQPQRRRGVPQDGSGTYEQPRQLTTMTAAEKELAQLPACLDVLLVPGNARGLVRYSLSARHVRSIRPLPHNVPRVQGPAQLELEVVPSPDGTNSLVCLA
jgi:hypothetical protein